MKINYLKIKNVRSIVDSDFEFSDINYITGFNYVTDSSNGSGKTSLIEGIFYLLHGTKLLDVNVAKFINRDAKSGYVEGEIEVKGDTLYIKRELKKTGTGKLLVLVNGEDAECEVNGGYQDILTEYIGTPDNFKKFRLIDNSSGINVLSFTPTQLRKSLMNMCQDKFDGLRQKILDKKKNFEKLNKSHVISNHAPSDKRLSILGEAISEINTSEIDAVIRKYQNERYQLSSKQGELSKVVQIKKSQGQKLNLLNTCPSCFQKVPSDHKENICAELNTKIKEATGQLTELIDKLSIYDDLVNCESKKQTKLNRRKEKLNSLKHKLETRLQQKEYIFSDKDVELAKSAVEVVDRFANYYLLEWVNNIQPLVNQYISILGMDLDISVNEKGSLNISVNRDGKSFDYDMLSQGEKLFLSFIFKVALLLHEGEQGLMIADEGMNNLDKVNINRILTVIEKLPIQMIFTSHNTELELDSVNVIFVENKNGVSKRRV